MASFSLLYDIHESYDYDEHWIGHGVLGIDVYCTLAFFFFIWIRQMAKDLVGVLELFYLLSQESGGFFCRLKVMGWVDCLVDIKFVMLVRELYYS